MSRLEKIKDKVAKNHGYDSWQDMVYSDESQVDLLDERVNEVANKYATECVKASLEKASRVAKTFKNSNSGSYLDASIDKNSITQESNIVIL